MGLVALWALWVSLVVWILVAVSAIVWCLLWVWFRPNCLLLRCCLLTCLRVYLVCGLCCGFGCGGFVVDWLLGFAGLVFAAVWWGLC